MKRRKNWSTLVEGYKYDKLIYRECDKLDLKSFSDSDSACILDSRKNTSGYCPKIDISSGAISWASNFQKCVSPSTAEAELNAIVKATKEAVHLANVLKEMNIDVE